MLGTHKKALSPVAGKRAVVYDEETSVIVLVSFGGGRRAIVEVARGPNRFVAGIRHLKSGGLIPVVVGDGVRVFGVGFLVFAGEDLCLLPEPTIPQSRDYRAVGLDRPEIRATRARRERDRVRDVRPRLEVPRGRRVSEDRPHWRGYEVALVHGRNPENLLDRSGHVDLRVERVVGRAVLDGVGADDIARAAVTVNVIDAVLCIVFLDEDHRRRPYRAVADDVDIAAKSQVVVSLHGLRGWRAAGVVRANPHHLELGYCTSRHILGEVLLPDIDAELVRDAQVELRVVLDRVTY